MRARFQFTGTFLRTFTLPDAKDGSFKDDVLKVRLPRSETPKPKAGEVKVT